MKTMNKNVQVAEKDAIRKRVEIETSLKAKIVSLGQQLECVEKHAEKVSQDYQNMVAACENKKQKHENEMKGQ